MKYLDREPFERGSMLGGKKEIGFSRKSQVMICKIPASTLFRKGRIGPTLAIHLLAAIL